jgi:hypothetical protein
MKHSLDSGVIHKMLCGGVQTTLFTPAGTSNKGGKQPASGGINPAGLA